VKTKGSWLKDLFSSDVFLKSWQSEIEEKEKASHLKSSGKKKLVDWSGNDAESFRPIYDKLLSFGGDDVSIPVASEKEIGLLQSDKCRFFSGESVSVRGDPNMCHRNVAVLWKSNPDMVIYSGYALSDDGVWRQHSWGFDDGTVIETCVKRKKYFGYPLNKSESKEFFVAEAWEDSDGA
jgi:hypothetical protein